MKREPSNDLNLSSMSTRGHRRKKHNKTLIAVNVITSLVLVLSIVALSGILLLGAKPLENTQGEEKETNSDLQSLQVSTSKNVSYILVVGVDVSQTLTDVIMVACVDHEKNSVSILQIPRDTFIGTDIPTGKINAVYGNPKKGEAKINALRRRVSNYLGIPLDQYVIFTIQGFKNVVDAIGGVEINITQKNGIKVERFATGEQYTLGPGWVTLDGEKAEGFVRKRYGSEAGYGLGDISRVQQQRIFYAALFKKLKTMNFGQVTKIATSCYKEVGTSMSVGQILGYAKELQGLNFDQVKMYTIPGQFCNYKGLSYYSIHKSEYVELFNTFFNPYGAPITASGIKIRELHTEIGQATTGSVVKDGGSISEIIEDTKQ